MDLTKTASDSGQPWRGKRSVDPSTRWDTDILVSNLGQHEGQESRGVAGLCGTSI